MRYRNNNLKIIFVWVGIVCLILGIVVIRTILTNTKTTSTIYSIDTNNENNTNLENNEETKINNETEKLEEAENDKDINIKKIKVQVAGEVINGGVYELTEGQRVEDAINMAGGFTEEANETSINLAKFLIDEEQIIVGNINDVDVLGSIQTNENSSIININKADVTQMQTLPSIGAVTAKRIIDYRTENGNFKSIEDIKNVKGIGDKTFESFKDLITVN